MTKESKASSAKRTSLKPAVGDSTLLERPAGEVGDSTLLGAALKKVVGEDSTLVGTDNFNFDSTPKKQAEDGQVEEEEEADSTLIGTESDPFDSTSEQAEEGQDKEEESRASDSISQSVPKPRLCPPPKLAATTVGGAGCAAPPGCKITADI